ncbi:MAG: biopolymer transporter ExbD [Candidatus Babeliales bacterium]|nr:biopolymer transporter ExbD [Candidatus Babeliales bacterium]
MRFKRRRRLVALPEVSLTPLIDTALNLLVIFMVATPMLQNSLKINLPEAKNKKDYINAKQQNIEINIDDKGKVYLNEKEVELKNIIEQVKIALANSKDKIVILKADKSVEYDKVIKVLDLVNSIEGEKYVALATKQQ